MSEYKFVDNTPTLAVDIIIRFEDKILMIKRKYPPYGLAFPGGHVDKGESVLDAARRELKEECGIEASFLTQLHTYSKPDRDPRRHVVSVVFVAQTGELPVAGDDAAKVLLLTREEVHTSILAFDHWDIFQDFLEWESTGTKPSFDR